MIQKRGFAGTFGCDWSIAVWNVAGLALMALVALPIPVLGIVVTRQRIQDALRRRTEEIQVTPEQVRFRTDGGNITFLWREVTDYYIDAAPARGGFGAYRFVLLAGNQKVAPRPSKLSSKSNAVFGSVALE